MEAWAQRGVGDDMLVGDDKLVRVPARLSWYHSQVFAMNNMFVSLLIYLTVRLYQQKSRRLTLARAGAFAIGRSVGQSCASFLPAVAFFSVLCAQVSIWLMSAWSSRWRVRRRLTCVSQMRW
jgi:hypothetical protein